VLIEKPLAATVAEARSIVQAARGAGRVLMVEMTHRFYPPVRAARELVQSGRLGKLFAVQDTIIDPVNPELMAPWLFQRASAGGGVALTNGIHMLDRIAWVCGQRLRFHSGLASWSQQVGDVEDTATMQLTLEDGTPVALLAAFPRTRAAVDNELTLYGTGGTLRVWSWRGWRFEPAGSELLAGGQPEEHAAYPPDAEHATKVQVAMMAALTEFVAAITEGRTPNPDPAEIVAAQELVEQFYQQVRCYE
jgi:predicted dehydrogenase